MAIHLLRDYQNQNFITYTPDQIPWLCALFCYRVLGYTVVGQTNFDLDSATYLKASGSVSPNRAGINFGAGFDKEVSIPAGVRTVSVADVGRMLVLRSTSNPKHNSGIFLITGINTADNRYVIDFRSTDSPPAEAADSISWWLYEKDSTIPQDRTTNGASSGYHGYGASSNSRVILQSPHASGWQVRIALEMRIDWAGSFIGGGTTTCTVMSFAPGLNGNSAGDFVVGGEHTHSVLWWDTNDPNRATMHGVGTYGSFASTSSTEQYRVTMVGDDEGHGVYCFIRRPFGPVPGGVPAHYQFQFGLPENEPTPVPTRTVRRLFTFGNSTPGNGSQVFIGNWANSFHYHGLTQGFNGQPVTCNIASWSFIETNTAVSNNSSGAPVFASAAADNPFTNATDLLPLDVVAGFGENWFNNQNLRTHQFEPRTMGTLPFVRAGRGNVPLFSITTDPANSWQHVQHGLYIVWGGPAVLP